MITLKQGEAIKKAFDARCKFGAGMLYVTNQRIVFEISKQGVLLDLPYEEVKNYQAISKDTLLLNWEESGKGRFNIEFKIKHANEVEYEIKSANEEYAKAMNMVDVLKRKKSAYIQEKICIREFSFIPCFFTKPELTSNTYFAGSSGL